MSGEVLSNDQVAALVAAASEGTLPEETSRPAPRRARRVRKVDFTRPTKFTTEQERRLKRAHDTFCRTASTRLSTELRMPVELEVINMSQLTWSNAHAELPDSSICSVLDIAPIGGRMLLAAELPLVISLIERLLGGSVATTPRDRKLTEIDWVVASRLFTTLTDQLSAIWQELADLSLSVVSADVRAESAHMAMVSDPTLAMTIEVRMNRASHTLILLVPYRSIEPVAGRLRPAEGASAEERAPETAAAVRHALGGVEVELRAEVARAELTVESVLALKPGDVLSLGAPAADGVALYADDVLVGRAQPGRNGHRRAVQIVTSTPGALEP
jgi:flagellar motor switch protein FliM